LLFTLMAQDPAPSLYVGRPCYLQTADARCDARWWTFWRYGDDVVDSLAEVIRNQAAAADLVLIGHSGGGALAVLLAPRLSNVSAVVTLAGNLDVAAWTSLHGYMPLEGSLDPALQPPLPVSITQWHFAAAQDEAVPVGVMTHFCERQTNAGQMHCATVPDTTHVSGWQPWWKDFAATLTAPRKRY
jgi:dienelactone hydrolase